MENFDIIFAKIYIVDSAKILNSIVDYLKEHAKINHINVFRAVCDYAKRDHQSPGGIFECNITLEFYDVREKVEPALKHLSHMVRREHLLYWGAKYVQK